MADNQESSRESLEAKLEPGARELKNGAVVVEKGSNPIFYGLTQALSIPEKILFLDKRWGAKPTKETIDMIVNDVEKNENLKNLTVRFNHASPIRDTIRLFTDDKVMKEVPWYVRMTFAPGVFLNSLMANIFRSDHYNPITHTAHVFTDIPAVGMHEIGHADYFAGEYHTLFPLILLGGTGIGTLYQEAVATRYANKNLPKGEKYQTGRYLFPAFGTYIGAVSGIGLLPGIGLGYLGGAAFNGIRKLMRGPGESTVAQSPNQHSPTGHRQAANDNYPARPNREAA